jgi:hypothetical protein
VISLKYLTVSGFDDNNVDADVIQPSEETVSQLVAMGFNRQSAYEALVMNVHSPSFSPSIRFSTKSKKKQEQVISQYKLSGCGFRLMIYKRL